MARPLSNRLADPFARWQQLAVAAVSAEPQLASLHWHRRGAGTGARLAVNAILAAALMRADAPPPRGRRDGP